MFTNTSKRMTPKNAQFFERSKLTAHDSPFPITERCSMMAE